MKKHLVVFSGAGISAESGLPTYRDKNGLWKDEKLSDLMSAGGYYEKPKAVLDALNEMRILCYLAEPNEAHKKIAELEEDFNVTVITQNVDDLHERAGSSNVLHLHGKLSEVTSSDNRCDFDCIQEYPMNKLIRLGDKAKDGSQLRPNVILFGEYLTEYGKAVEIIKTADIFLVIGTSLQVFPASKLINQVPPTAKKYILNPDLAMVCYIGEYTVIPEIASSGMIKFVEDIRNYIN